MPIAVEQALHGAVLAVRPMQRDQRSVGPRLAQELDQVDADVEANYVVAEALERVLGMRAGA